MKLYLHFFQNITKKNTCTFKTFLILFYMLTPPSYPRASDSPATCPAFQKISVKIQPIFLLSFCSFTFFISASPVLSVHTYCKTQLTKKWKLSLGDRKILNWSRWILFINKDWTMGICRTIKKSYRLICGTQLSQGFCGSSLWKRCVNQYLHMTSISWGKNGKCISKEEDLSAQIP